MLYLPVAKAILNGKEIPSWKRFYARRAIRILPAYVIALAIWFFYSEAAVHWVNWRADLLTHLTFTHTFFPYTVNSINGVLWSLGVEVHYYLLLPLMAWLFRKNPVLFFFSCSAISLLSGLLNTCHLCSFNFFSNIPYYLDEFAAGMLVAHFVANGTVEQWARRWVRYALDGIVVILILGLPYAHIPYGSPIMGLWSLGWAVAILAAMTPGSLTAACFSWKPIMWVGIISYSMYLMNFTYQTTPHWLFARIVAGDRFAILIAFALTLAVGAIGYYLFELPFLGLRQRLHTTPPAPAKPAAQPVADAQPAPAESPALLSGGV